MEWAGGFSAGPFCFLREWAQCEDAFVAGTFGGVGVASKPARLKGASMRHPKWRDETRDWETRRSGGVALKRRPYMSEKTGRGRVVARASWGAAVLRPYVYFTQALGRLARGNLFRSDPVNYFVTTRMTKVPGFILPRRSPGAGGSKSAAGRKML
jgi:hypothetical protein